MLTSGSSSSSSGRSTIFSAPGRSRSPGISSMRFHRGMLLHSDDPAATSKSPPRSISPTEGKHLMGGRGIHENEHRVCSLAGLLRLGCRSYTDSAARRCPTLEPYKYMIMPCRDSPGSPGVQVVIHPVIIDLWQLLHYFLPDVLHRPRLQQHASRQAQSARRKTRCLHASIACTVCCVQEPSS